MNCWTAFGNALQPTYSNLIEGSLEVQLPTIWTKTCRGEKNQRREEKTKEDQGRERVRRKKMQVRREVDREATSGGCGAIWEGEDEL